MGNSVTKEDKVIIRDEIDHELDLNELVLESVVSNVFTFVQVIDEVNVEIFEVESDRVSDVLKLTHLVGVSLCREELEADPLLSLDSIVLVIVELSEI